jgi:hypothetical protein
MFEALSPKIEDERSGVANKARDILGSIRLAVRLLKSDSITPYLELDSGECIKLADYYIRHGVGNKAICLLMEAVLKDPENIEAKWKYALFNENNHPRIAIDMCNEILKRNPYHAGAMELKIDLEADLDIK